MKKLMPLSRALLVMCILAFQMSCSSEQKGGTLRIGINPDWDPLDFGAKQPYVNGFVEELLLEMAQYSGIVFEKIETNWDSLFDGLEKGNYNAVLSSLPPHPFLLEKYDFSANFLQLGPVLILPIQSGPKELSNFEGESIGILTGDPAQELLSALPNIIVRNYPSIPMLLDALVGGEIEGALLNRIFAYSFVNDLYRSTLKIGSPPLTEEGLHLIAKKGEKEATIKLFEKTLFHFKKEKRLETLLKKWRFACLSPSPTH